MAGSKDTHRIAVRCLSLDWRWLCKRLAQLTDVQEENAQEVSYETDECAIFLSVPPPIPTPSTTERWTWRTRHDCLTIFLSSYQLHYSKKTCPDLVFCATLETVFRDSLNLLSSFSQFAKTRSHSRSCFSLPLTTYVLRSL